MAHEWMVSKGKEDGGFFRKVNEVNTIGRKVGWNFRGNLKEKLERCKNMKMETKNKNIFLWLGVLGLIAVLVISGCIEQPKPPPGADKSELNGTLTIVGSTTVLPIVQKAAEIFMTKHPNVNIEVSGGGSSVGVRGVGTKAADIGMVSRELKESEKEEYPDLVSYAIAKDGIVIIVNPQNPISALTEEQIRKIYEGTYTNWKDLGGNDQEIVVVTRDAASGTGEFFLKYIMKKGNITKKALEKASNGAVLLTLSQTPGAIGYVGLGFVDATVKPISINKNGTFIEPTSKNILEGKYPLSRNVYLITHGPAEGLEKEFIDFIMSKEGQEIVEKEGFVPVK